MKQAKERDELRTSIAEEQGVISALRKFENTEERSQAVRDLVEASNEYVTTASVLGGWLRPKALHVLPPITFVSSLPFLPSGIQLLGPDT